MRAARAGGARPRDGDRRAYTAPMILCARCGTENPAGFRFCGNCAAPLESPTTAPAERRKVVTVVFCDVVGSTSLGEQRDPETIRAIMARYFETLRAVLESHGGTVEKFIGDAVMAVFGHPVLHEDDALRAVRAAGDLRTALAELNHELERDWGVNIETRTGINTGQVVAGETAAAETLVTGDAVNVAARLQTAAEAGETLIGEETYALVRDAVDADEVSLSLKGKELPVRAWRLLSVIRDAAGRARHLDSPLVGRQRERQLLDAAFEQAVRDRTCVMFTLLGSAGVGKSRLVHEFLTGVGDRARVVRGRCLPYGEGITYWPLAEAVKALAAISEGDSPAAARAAIERIVEEGGEPPAIGGHVAGAIGLGVERATNEELFWAVRRFFEIVAQDEPLVVVFDDIQWAEPTFLDLIENFADWSRDAPILLLCVARPELLELRPTWAGGKLHASTLLLEPLSETEVASLIENLLDSTSLGRSLIERLSAAAEGNPLFVEEFVAMLIDDGVLRHDDGRWLVAGAIEQVSVPPTIRSLLAARIDRLAAPERRVIERASVVGKIFWRGAVAELAPEPMRPEVGPSLLSLVRKELVRPDRSDFAGDDAFRFRHLLLRDAAYDALPKQERVGLHERFAGWLDRTAGDRVTEYEEVLGYHLEQAYRYRAELGPLDEAAQGLGRRAAERLAAAGRRAADRGDAAAAANLLERATELLGGGDQLRLELLPELGSLLVEHGQMERGGRLLDEAVELADAAGLERLRWFAQIRRASYRIYAAPEGATERYLPEVQAATAALEELGDSRGAAEGWLVQGYTAYYLGRLADERVIVTRAVEAAARAGDDRLELEGRVNRAASGLWADNTPLSEVLAEADEILDRARTLGRRLPEAQALGIRGRVVANLGEFDEGRRLVAEARAILRDLGRVSHAAGASHWAGVVEWLAGNPAGVEAVLREGAEVLEAMGERAMLSTSYGDMAVALEYLGRLTEADELCRRAEELTASDDVASQLAWRVARARIEHARGDLDEALRIADEGLRIIDATEYASMGAWAREHLAGVLLAGRGTAAAAAALQTAIDYMDRRGAIGVAPRLRARLAELEMGGGAQRAGA